MAIRLAALDVDGTLLAPDNSITPATKEAIREAKAAGIEIVVCTGRAFVEVRDILRQLPEVRYLSCGTGAYALDVWTMETLYECSMPEELGKQAYRAVAQADCMVHFYTGLSVRHSRWCMDHFTDYMEEKMRTLMEQSHIIVDDLDAFVESYHGPVEKLYVTFPNRAEYEKAYEAVRKLPVFLTDGGWAVDLEVMSRDTDKGVALRALAEKLGATAVVTTATDVRGKFSVDAWAARHGCVISDMGLAKAVSAAILEGNVPLCSQFPLPSPLPEGTFAGESGPLGIFIGWRTKSPFARTLRLIPRVLRVGVGCRRGISAEAVENAVQAVFAENGLDTAAICGVCSIDLKQDEAGLLAACEKNNWPVHFYTAQQLRDVAGNFTPSDFVRSVTGVDNVCERAALLDAEKLIVQKTARDGVTIAVAAEHWEVRFG